MALAGAKVDVAIIGGGPCGFALAKGLLAARPSLKVQVFERVPKLVPAGAAVGMRTNGMNALAAINEVVAKKVAAAGRLPNYSVAFGPDGEVQERGFNSVASISAAAGEHYGFLRWSELQSILYDSLPTHTIQFNHRFERYEAGADGCVTLHFSSPAKPVTARIVVGCDGYFSQLRNQWRNDDDPAFAGVVAWRGQTSYEDAPFWKERSTFSRHDRKVLSVFPGSDDVLVWVLTVTEPRIAEAGLEPYQRPQHQRMSSSNTSDNTLKRRDAATRKQRALTLAAEYPELLRSVVACAKEETVLESGVYYRPFDKYPETKLGDGPITLAGDAFHVIRPTGQGVNQAFEDAVVLSACLARKGLCEAALREYEAIRLPRVKRIAQASELQAAANYEQDVKLREALMQQVQELSADVLNAKFESLASLAS